MGWFVLTKLFYAHFGFMFCLFLSWCVVVVGREGGRKFFIKNFLNNFFRKLPICSHFVGNKAKGCFKKTPRQIFRKTNIFYPLVRPCMWAYQGVRNVRFSENLAWFVFLKHTFWDSPFRLITDELQFANIYKAIQIRTLQNVTKA